MSSQEEPNTKASSDPKAGEAPGAGQPSPQDSGSDEVSESQLAEIDALIREEDPKFEGSLKDVEQIKGLAIDLGEDAADITDDLFSDKEQEAGTGDGAFEDLADRPAPMLFIIRKQLQDQLRRLRFGFKSFFRDLVPNAKVAAISVFKALIFAARTIFKFAIRLGTRLFQLIRDLSLREKILVLLTCIVTLAIVIVGRWTIANRFLSLQTDPYLHSLAQVADGTFQVPSGAHSMDFYDDFSPAKFFVLLKKMVVNLQPSAHSSQNPMGAFQFVLQGSSRDVTIEIKDREDVVQDAVQSVLEQVPYDELLTPVGKAAVKDLIRTRVNSILKSGQVRHVLINAIVLKP